MRTLSVALVAIIMAALVAPAMSQFKRVEHRSGDALFQASATIATNKSTEFQRKINTFPIPTADV